MTMTPYEMCYNLTEAAKTMPFIKSVPIKIINASGAGERDISLDEVKVAFNIKKTFPNLYSKSSTAYDRIGQLEAQVAALQDTCRELWSAV